MTRIVGLSGGIGSGKSTVSRQLAALGATVIDADAIVHELQAPGSPMLAEIAAAFGPGVIDAEGASRSRRARRDRLPRRRGARAPGRDRAPARRRPRSRAAWPRRAARARRVVVLDIPLLFEGRKAGTGSAAALQFDATVLVWAPEQAQIERQIARDGCSRDEALRRVRAQLPLDEKKALADYVIDNSGTPEETERQVRALWETLSRRPARAGAP